MSSLAGEVKVSPRFSRSANLERDVKDAALLDGYVVTARALDVVERLAASASRQAGGAWSITGPYGSGKSSLAVLLDGCFGPDGDVRDTAIGLVGDASLDVAAAIRLAHTRHDTAADGFFLATVTANREPISHTITKALESAVVRRYGKIPPKRTLPTATLLRTALSDMASKDPRRTGPSPADLVEVARSLAERAPLLILVDEFGKNLQAVDQSTDTDPYLLQLLAEAGQGNGSPIFTVTMQHLSFEDYFAGSEGPERNEWAKVQGRFEDIPYVDSAAQTRALISTVFEPSDGLKRRIGRWAVKAAKAVAPAGIEDLSDPASVEGCYPLHPVAAAVLPELCSRYGQNERTLFSFLTGPEHSTVASFLTRTELKSRGSLPTVGLPQIYDYFVDGGLGAGSQSSRWTEVATRLRDTHGLSDDQSAVAKSVAVLNLVSASGTLRASERVLSLLHSGAASVLASLEEMGLVTYRGFADDYRIWQGSDVDLRILVDAAKAQISHRPLAALLNESNRPTPVVAARHSSKNQMLRVFSRRYVEGTEAVDPLSPFDNVDGEILLVVGAERTCPSAPPGAGLLKPVVAAIPLEVSDLDEAARTLAAIRNVLDRPEVVEDWVARRELGEQLAHAEASFEAVMVSTFEAGNCDWFLLSEAGPQKLSAGRGSGPVSEAADIAYPHTPLVGNEMINRTELTSQGAKARRMVLEGMIEQSDQSDLGFEGYGPEVAMYRSVLGRSGIHRNDGRNESMVFATPTDASLLPAWEAMEAQFRRARSRRINLNDVYGALMSPPIGMKAAVVPILVTAGLLMHADEIAIYEHGTFKPVLGSDVSERMVKNPNHFDIKHYANASGARREVIDQLAIELGVAKRFRKHRVGNVLAIVGHLVGVISTLDNYTLRTGELRDKTIRVREVLRTAIEPDELLFVLLPQAVGFPPVDASETYPQAGAFARAVSQTVRELEGNLRSLLDELAEELLAAAGESRRSVLTAQAAGLQDEVIDPDIRSFVLTVGNDSVDTNEDWVAAVATVITRKAVAEWKDEDRLRFDAELRARMAAFHRLVALHAEAKATGDGPFTAMRVTVTLPDGKEGHRLAVIEDHDRAVATEVLESAVAELRGLVGSDTAAKHLLLGLLGESIVPSESASRDDATIDLRGREARHG